MFQDFDDIPYDYIKSLVKIDQLTPLTIKNKRIFVLGPANSGKDTLAVALSKYVWFGGTSATYKGSTSLTMLPFVYDVALTLPTSALRPYLPQSITTPALRPYLQSMTLAEFYELRTECRIFWYNVIKAYRELDPYFIMCGDNAADIYVGSRDWTEIKSCVDCTLNAFFVLCRMDSSNDPTWPYSYEYSRTKLIKDFEVDPRDIVTFDYKDSNFELFLNIQKTAQELGRVQNLRVSYLSRDSSAFELHGVRFDDVLKGRF